MNKKKSFSPQNLRSLLGFLLFVLIAGGAGLFYMGIEKLKTYSLEVNQQLATAEANEKRVDNLRALKSALSDSTNLIAKADKLFSTPGTYKTGLETDIRNHAAAANIAIDAVNFEDPPTPQGPYLGTVELRKAIEYTSFIKFLDGIESNTPKIQVESLSINRVESNKTMIAVTNLRLKVAVR